MSASEEQRLGFGFAWSALGRGFTLGSAIAIHLVLAAALPLQELGAYSVGLALATPIALIALQGAPAAIVRFGGVAAARGSRDLARSANRKAAVLVFAGAASTCGALGLGGWSLIVGGTTSGAVLGADGLLGSALVAALIARAVASEGFRSRRKFAAAAVFGGAASNFFLLIGAVALWLLVPAFDAPLALWLFSLAVGGTSAIGILLLRFTRVQGANDGAVVPWGDWLRTSGALWVYRLIQLPVSLAPLWALAVLAPATQAGAYGMAARLATLVALWQTIANGVLPPIVAQLHAAGYYRQLEGLLRQSATVATGLALVTATCLMSLGPILFGLVLPLEYGLVWHAAGVLCAAELVGVACGSVGVALTMCGETKALIRITAVQAGVVGVLSIVLAGPLGATGGALACAAGILIANVAGAAALHAKTGCRSLMSVRALRRPAATLGELASWRAVRPDDGSRQAGERGAAGEPPHSQR